MQHLHRCLALGLGAMAVLCAASNVYLDNTASGANAIISASPTTMTAATQLAFSFAVSEEDSSCGPGTYAISNVTLALSQYGSVTSVGMLLFLYATNSSGAPKSSAIGVTVRERQSRLMKEAQHAPAPSAVH